MTIAGKARSYLRFIPPSYDSSKPLALVLAFHGSGGTSEKTRATFALEAQAAGKAIFVYPQGLPDPAFANDNRWDPDQGSDDYTFLDAVLAEVEASHCVDRDREFAVGFSNGARMTSMVGCYRGTTFRAIAPVAPGGDATTLPLSGCVGEVGIWRASGTTTPIISPAPHGFAITIAQAATRGPRSARLECGPSSPASSRSARQTVGQVDILEFSAEPP
jgi:poly(3-hydroxybutyrate) depolymerase